MRPKPTRNAGIESARNESMNYYGNEAHKKKNSPERVNTTKTTNREKEKKEDNDKDVHNMWNQWEFV